MMMVCVPSNIVVSRRWKGDNERLCNETPYSHEFRLQRDANLGPRDPKSRLATNCLPLGHPDASQKHLKTQLVYDDVKKNIS